MSSKGDLGKSKTGIFFNEGLDDPNHVDPAQQFSLCAHVGRGGSVTQPGCSAAKSGNERDTGPGLRGACHRAALRADPLAPSGLLADKSRQRCYCERMVLPMSDLLKRITIDADRMHGRPCIRGLRVTVADILGLMSAGQSRETILQEYPYLEDADIDAVLAFAARQADHPIIAAE
jgi:uncharacterized protein (DUF433 family)